MITILVGSFTAKERAAFAGMSSDVAWYFADLDCDIFDNFLDCVKRIEYVKRRDDKIIVIAKPVYSEGLDLEEERYVPVRYDLQESIVCLRAYCKITDVPFLIFDGYISEGE